MRALITGASGFVGAHLVRRLLAETDSTVVVPVSFRHRGDSQRLEYVLTSDKDWMRRTTVILHDLTTPFSPRELSRIGEIDVIYNLASESHVDRSISFPEQVIRNNVNLMTTMLETARILEPSSFVHMSTDEVFGDADLEKYELSDWKPALPSSPYAASKAAQESIALAYWRTFGVPLTLVNASNLLGEMQDPEKFLPRVISRVASRRTIYVHLDSSNRPGQRYYMSAVDLADALMIAARSKQWEGAENLRKPPRFHLGGLEQVANDEMIKIVSRAMGVTNVDVQYVAGREVRPGYDSQYARPTNSLMNFGWSGPSPIKTTVERVVHWSLQNRQWLEPSDS